MARRVWRPAVDGTTTTGPILDGMRFHDTRHTHKTWLIEDDIPRSLKPAASDTGYPASAASTATSPPS